MSLTSLVSTPWRYIWLALGPAQTVPRSEPESQRRPPPWPIGTTVVERSGERETRRMVIGYKPDGRCMTVYLAPLPWMSRRVVPRIYILPEPPYLATAPARDRTVSETIKDLEAHDERWLCEHLGRVLVRLERSFRLVREEGGFNQEILELAPSLSAELRRLSWMRAAAVVAVQRLRARPLQHSRRHALLALRAVECAERGLLFEAYWQDVGGEG